MAVQATLVTAIPAPKNTLSLAFSPDSRWLAAAGMDKQVPVVEVATGQPRFSVRHGSWFNSWASGVAFSVDGRWLATCGFDRAARVWAADTGRKVREIRQKTSKGNPGAGHARLQAVAFSPDGRWLATGSADCTARIFEVASGQELLRVTNDPGVGEVAFSPDGRRLATSGKDTRIWDAATGEELLGVLHDFCGHVAFSPDGRRFATSGTETGRYSESARIWDADTGQEQLKVHHDGASGVAFSPDGRWLVTGGADTARIWDAHSGEELGRVRHDDPKTVSNDAIWAHFSMNVALSPDGRLLASYSSWDDTVRIWGLHEHTEG
jgi:WD40 repeat protein